MPESRDRIVRTINMAAGSARWPLVFGSNLFDRPCRLETPISNGTAAIRIRREDRILTTRNVYRGQGGRNLGWMRMPLARARGTPDRMRDSIDRERGVNNVLPSWYPPLRDITTVARAYDERRRLSRLRGGCKDSDLMTKGCFSPGSSSGDTPLKQDDASVFTTPYHPSGSADSCKQSVCKILLDVVNMKSGDDSEFLTPQRKLMNEIDTVREVVLDGIRQFNETPLAKTAERERKVRVLMSMRLDRAIISDLKRVYRVYQQALFRFSRKTNKKRSVASRAVGVVCSAPQRNFHAQRCTNSRFSTEPQPNTFVLPSTAG